MNTILHIINLAQIQSTTEPSLKGIGTWLGNHWLLLVLIFLAIIIFFVLIFLVLIPVLRRLFWRLKQAKEAKKYSEELLLRKNLATVARGGKEGDEAEIEALSSYIAEIKAELAFGKTVFRKERKNIYDIPWFFMLGEPGSGKSTLMRRSGLDMPANIVDFSQGESGTSTFHWWFAPEGIIIDVAGRILFSRWGGKGDAEWRYLIKQAKKMRGKHPLNGIVVTVPADSLIADNSDLVKRKAKMLSDEIAILQKSLGMSLPVYVMISKMDYVTGFSEIFSELPDEERKRIFGWSGPEDSLFTPEAINEYFASTYQEMSDFASSSMLATDFTGGSGAERMKCVKSIYSFPDAFAGLKDNLALYLQAIFSFTNWSGKKSLLFRGVYFSSALDLGKRLEQGEDVSILTTDSQEDAPQEAPFSRPAFIHDVFTIKIFPEQGLATFLPHMLRKRRIPSLITAILLLLAAGFIYFFSFADSFQIDRDVSQIDSQWNSILQKFEKRQIEKSPTVVLNKNNEAELLLLRSMDGEMNLSREEMLMSLFKKSNTVWPIPWIFRFSQPWLRLYSENMLSDERYSLLQMAYADMIFLPVLDASRKQFIKPPENDKWNQLDTDALAMLIKIDIDGKARKYYGSNYSGQKGYYYLAPLFRYIFDNKINSRTMAFLAKQEYRKTLQEKGGLFAVQNPNSKTFFMLQPDSRMAENAIKVGVNRFCDQWETCSADPEMLFHDVKTISDLLDQFRSIEEKLNDNRKKLSVLGGTTTVSGANEILTAWHSDFKKLTAVAEKLQKSQEELSYRSTLDPDSLLQETAYQYSLRLHKSFSQLQNLIAKDKKYIRDDKFLNAISNKLDVSIKKADSYSQLQLMAIDARMQAHLYDWTKQAYSQQKAYMDRFSLYERLSEQIDMKLGEITLFNLPDKISLADSMMKKFNKYATQKKQQSQGDNYYNAAIDSALRILNLAYELKHFQIYDNVLKNAPGSVEELGKLIKKQSAAERIIPSSIFPFEPSTKSGTFNNEFHPDAAKKYLQAWDKLSNKLTGKKHDTKIVARDKLLTEYADKYNTIIAYKQRYVQYWAQDVLNTAMIPTPSSWRDFSEKTAKIKAYQVNGSIQYLSKEAIYALKNLKFTNVLLKSTVDEGVLYYQTQLSLLTGEFSKQSEACLSSWQAMPESQEDCCKYIMGFTDKQIANSLFSVYSTNPKTSLLWWNDFIKVGTESLSNHISTYVLTQATNFAEIYRQFPLCNTMQRTGALSIAEVDTASIKLSQYLKLPPGTSVQSLEKKTRKPAPPAANKEAMPLIRMIRPYYSLKYESQKKWFLKLKTVLDVLNNKTNPLFWNFAVPANSVQQEGPKVIGAKDLIPAAEKYRFVEFYMNGIQLGQRTSTAFSDGKPHPIQDIYGYINASNITIAFFEFANSKQPGATISFNGDWAAVQIYLRSGVTYEPKKKTHNIPLIFTDKDGARCFFWLGLTFNGKIPMPSQWPTLNDWFSFSKEKVIEKRNINHHIYFMLQKGNFAENKNKLIDVMQDAAPAGAVPAWEFYLPTLIHELRYPEIKDDTKSLANLLNAPVYNAKAKIPDVGVSLMRYMEIHVNGVKVSKRFQTMVPSMNSPRPMNLLLPLKSKNVEIHFFQYTDDKIPAKVIKLESDYPILNQMAKEGIIPENNKNGFLIPLRVKTGKHADYFYWLGVRASNLYQ